MPKKDQIIINNTEIKDIFNLIHKDIDILKKDEKLVIKKESKVVAIINLNEYNCIIGLKLQRRYGYLNKFILEKILGLVYKEETDGI